MAPALDPGQLCDLHWLDNGQCAFSGSLLALMEKVDRLFLAWSRQFQACEYQFPPLVSARELARIDYFRSFPHLATFAVSLDPDPENLAAFRDQDSARDGPDRVALTRASPIQDILCPAACYPIYIHFQDERLDGPRFVTVRSICYRREERYLPLQRQASFSMREIVCLGTAEEVAAFVTAVTSVVTAVIEDLGLPVAWQHATDPFFDPMRNSSYIAQKIAPLNAPLKREIVYDGHLAIGSLNAHHDFFGKAFQIRRSGETCHSACLAFGLERWLYAILSHFGSLPDQWPQFS